MALRGLLPAFTHNGQCSVCPKWQLQSVAGNAWLVPLEWGGRSCRATLGVRDTAYYPNRRVTSLAQDPPLPQALTLETATGLQLDVLAGRDDPTQYNTW